ncbi:succinate dehydrogenase hydrophobic membrane anchor subunit [Cellulomonas endophytica]|uniref:succinate dehydrogenase hydrophobic membrane anchor subunit n=1 Tax=Cellulomonas endophytica TaxID=2494735 RepID=UPI001012F780|nr:succinate dehydrogenase hydrophobic membrane anchor subunit [Cellulomonas endophytica]
MTTIADPKAPRAARPGPGRRSTRGNTELYGWVFMRVSGVLLLILIFTHLWSSLISGEGISQVDFGFVAGKWANPFWQVWDLTMLWLAMIHGTNGMRTIVNDYAEKDSTRLVLKSALYLAFTVVVVLGTLVIFTFDPCPAGAPMDLLPDVCSDLP